ncbi:Fidipidine, putative isoform 2 [Hibiscus syriacus]|uniref:Fidipidine, putative isoform 2 n=1 Tax=Hibiscus syriacus TaxID=106335 RepID=A0A6A2XKH2_HIBSY|nr:coiled-coil domain-containing protein 93-like [Hibiscus syriacus]KAE8676032.1 Fidipidine, putative isoform 2 [Hibiscus syriacus]
MQEGSSEQELNSTRALIAILNSNLDQKNQRKDSVRNELQNLQEKIRKEGAESKIQNLVSLLENLKLLERQESEIRSDFDAKRFSLEVEVSDLKGKLATGSESNMLPHSLDDSLNQSLEKLNLTKRELAARLRAIVSIKRQLDNAPSQSELIQYEHRFSELNAHIQEKLQQTRKFYATFNALLEIKELMLKETSLLNSINSQFQDAIASPIGRMKLLESMEGIVKGSQQKLEKVQIGLQEEQKICDDLKERYTAAVAEQRRCYSLLKAFQEECAKNERLRSQTSS